MLGPERPVILFEDAHLLAVGKPAGLLTQGIDAGEPTLETVVRRHLAGGAGDSAYVGTVHRLDRPVSGVVVWAKTPKAARRLADQFARREVGKLYWAIVEGDAAAIGSGGIWDDWLAPVDASGVVRVVDPHAPGAKRAVTRVASGHADRLPGGCSWLLLRPETGRTHQLRAQASARGLAILGDAPYGSLRPFDPGIALHARSLTVRHPVRRESLTFVAPLPESWKDRGIELAATSVPGT
jgi:23S rRNA pseudouridine1911/1915/1917 synthase